MFTLAVLHSLYHRGEARVAPEQRCSRPLASSKTRAQASAASFKAPTTVTTWAK
jgi:hypothetical protein